MNYSKPELSTFGDAREVIESIPSKTVNNLDPNQATGNPAYDLDE